jgi:hypothetical protein
MTETEKPRSTGAGNPEDEKPTKVGGGEGKGPTRRSEARADGYQEVEVIFSTALSVLFLRSCVNAIVQRIMGRRARCKAGRFTFGAFHSLNSTTIGLESVPNAA